MRKINWKLWLTVLLVGLSIYFLYPTWEWNTLTPQEREQKEKMRDKMVFKTLNLGLDLRGGSHLLLELDATKLDPKLDVSDAVSRAIEIIRNRVDQFGVAEPLITKQGDRWIVVQLPGIKDPSRAKELIGKTALLEFRLVDDNPVVSEIVSKLREKNATIADIDKYPEISSMVPAGFAVFAGKEDSYYLLKSSAELTGAYLVNAKVQFGGEYGYPYVNIEFNNDGAKIFAAVTERSIEKRLAIVLDGIVQSAPVIRSKIPDGKAIIEGNFTSEDARFLAMILRAGALPAPVKIIEERTVGPSLGDDSIKAGLTSCLVGLFVVLLFMFVYYRASGLIANFALILNLLFLLGVMAYFHFTLTLPGIAGIVLTLGMAVDANVLILERMREELAAGKTPRVAVDAGYQKAFSAILDANVTTLVASVCLFQFGTGPIKGFAVSLTIGLIVGMFTSIVVTRVIYDVLFVENIMTDIKI